MREAPGVWLGSGGSPAHSAGSPWARGGMRWGGGGSWPGMISEQLVYLDHKQLLWGVDTTGSEGGSMSGSVTTGAARTNRSCSPQLGPRAGRWRFLLGPPLPREARRCPGTTSCSSVSRAGGRGRVTRRKQTERTFQVLLYHSKKASGARLVAQWLRIPLPTQETWLPSLVQEDPTG